jgi:hypothetical protein
MVINCPVFVPEGHDKNRAENTSQDQGIQVMYQLFGMSHFSSPGPAQHGNISFPHHQQMQCTDAMLHETLRNP